MSIFDDLRSNLNRIFGGLDQHVATPIISTPGLGSFLTGVAGSVGVQNPEATRLAARASYSVPANRLGDLHETAQLGGQVAGSLGSALVGGAALRALGAAPLLASRVPQAAKVLSRAPTIPFLKGGFGKLAALGQSGPGVLGEVLTNLTSLPPYNTNPRTQLAHLNTFTGGFYHPGSYSANSFPGYNWETLGQGSSGEDYFNESYPVSQLRPLRYAHPIRRR